MSLQSEKKRKREEKWEAMFARLGEYVRTDGAAVFGNLAERDEETAKWVDAQRTARETGNLAKDKEARLSGLGLPWDGPPEVKKVPPPGVQPLKSVEEIEGLMARRKPSGHVPLGRRLMRQREAEAAAKLPPTEDLIAQMWERRVEALREARKRLPAPLRALDTWMYEEHEYGSWLRRQREFWANGDIPESQAKRLREIGAEPAGDGRAERRRRTWERNVKLLMELHESAEQRGEVFFDGLKDPKLKAWVRQQSKRGARGELREDERRFFDALGFPWRPEQWTKKERSAGRKTRKVTDTPGLSSPSRSVWLPLLKEKLEAAHAALPEPIREHLDTWRYAEVDDEAFQRRLWLLRRDIKDGRVNKEAARVLREYRVAAEVSRKRTLFELNALKLARSRESMDPTQRGRDFVALISDKTLQAWARKQASHYRRRRLLEDEIRFLNAVNVPLEIPLGAKRRARVWWDFCMELEQVKRDYGGFAYPPEHPRHEAMERWKRAQRNARRRGKLDADRAKRLEAIGFAWDGFAEEEELWERSFAKLAAYKERFGHVDVAEDWPEDPKLGKWVAKQRVALARPPMPRDRSTRLRRLGLKAAELPPIITRRWLDSLESVRTRLREDHGTAKLVPDTELDATSRGFIVNQRRRHRKGQLTDKQVRMLDELGIDWNPPRKYIVPVRGPQPPSAKWLENYNELKALFADHGPEALIDHKKAPRHLQKFATDQRMRRSRGILTEEKIRLLDAINFDWSPREKIRPAWMRRYEALKKFKEKHGTADVPRSYPPDQGLAEFVAQERQRARKGRLKPEQIQLLKDVGFRFESRPNRFKKGVDPRTLKRKKLPGAETDG
ncbi:MAG: helicase associated domain-containing protein [Opitutales bacterium]|nr:helicase associated domain-containing protein [Opitutales bacterium]